MPLLLILRDLLDVVRFGILEEDHILHPTDERELIEGVRLGLRSCRGDQSKRISLPEVAVTIGFEPDGNPIICGDEMKGRYRRQPRQAKAGRSETSIGDCSLRRLISPPDPQSAISTMTALCLGCIPASNL